MRTPSYVVILALVFSCAASGASPFASTDELSRWHVVEVISALPLVEVRGDLVQLLVGGAARWSLASNAYQHEKVLVACEDALECADGATKRLLEQIVVEAKAKRKANPPPEPW